jgi:hypothetical protein
VVFWRRQPPGAWLFVAQGVAYGGYLIYIGGDHFEFRFMTPVLPLIYLLWTEWARQITQAIPRPAGQRQILVPVAAGLSALLILASAVRPSLTRLHPTWGIVSLEEHYAYVSYRIEEGRFLRRLVLAGHLPADTVIAVRGAGALPYFSRLPIVDIHGLNDRTVARKPLERRGKVGHEKHASEEYLRERKTAIVEIFRRIIYPPGFSPDSRQAEVSEPFFSGKVRRLRIDGTHLAIGTTLPEEDFRALFRDFEHLP